MATLQDLWRAVHVQAANSALSIDQMDALRAWARDRAQRMPGTVFAENPRSMLVELRPSFLTALRHRAQGLARGQLEEDGGSMI